MNPRSPGRRAALWILIAALALTAACTLPTDDNAQILSGPEIDNAMNPTTTSTTRPLGTTRDRALFLFDDEDLLAPVLVQTPLDADVTQILNLLAPSDEELDGRNAVPDGFLVSTTVLSSDGTLEIVLADDTLFELGGEQLPQAAAQIVVTATCLDLDDDTVIEQVRFTLDDEPRQVPTGDGSDTDEPVDASDYRAFLPPGFSCAGVPQAPTSSTSTTTEALPPEG